MSVRPSVRVVFGLALGVALGCAGRSNRSKSPEACMSTCDQEQCQFEADGLGDNDDYIECLEACEDKCSR